MCKARFVSIMLWPVSPCWASLAVGVCQKGVLMGHKFCYLVAFLVAFCVLSFGFRIFCWYRGFCHRTGSDLLLFLFAPQFKMLSTFKILFKIMYFWKVMQSNYKGKTSKNEKISWIVRRRDKPTGKYLLFSNRCRKVTRRGIKIFASYELFRIFWFFIWYNSNKKRTCIAIVTRRWSEVEMTRNSVKFYAISNDTLSYPCDFNGVFLQFEWKKYISEFWKIISSFQNILDSFLRQL